MRTTSSRWPFLILRKVSTPGQLAFVPEIATDLALDAETAHAELGYLAPPP